MLAGIPSKGIAYAGDLGATRPDGLSRPACSGMNLAAADRAGVACWSIPNDKMEIPAETTL